MKILFTDPDDLRHERMISMEDFMKKIKKRTFKLPLFFDGVIIDEDNEELFDYMFTIVKTPSKNKYNKTYDNRIIDGT